MPIKAKKTISKGRGRQDCRLTQLSSCAGCAAKLPQSMLAELLGYGDGDRVIGNPKVLISSDTFDDAGVYQLRADLAIVQTVDFFTPIVDDPYDFGQIAAANAISDVYAMGGRPISALNLLGVPADKVSPAIVARILSGGLAKAREVGCAVLGGHTIRLPEPVYGMAVTGTIHPKYILSNAKARAGDLLILTKPLGTGITTTAIKRGLAPPPLVRRVVRSMKSINIAGAELAERRLVNAATDVTGFGLLGHLGNILRASDVSAEIRADDVPLFGPEILSLIEKDCVPGGTRSNLASAGEFTDFGEITEPMRVVLADAQTSGGLLLCVAPKNLEKVRQIVGAHRAPACAVIGRIIAGKPHIRVS